MSDGTVHETMDEAHPHVLLVTLDKPPVNVLTEDIQEQLRKICDGIRERHDVRCMIITGGGDNAFIGGGDVRYLATRDADTVLQRSAVAHQTFQSLRNCVVPVIAAVNASAIGSGVCVAASCDIVVASEKARFALPEIDVGAMGGGRQLLEHMPDKVMRYMVMTGDRVDAHYMEKHGFVHQVVAQHQVLEAAYRIADRIAGKSPHLMRLKKQAVQLTGTMTLAEGFTVEQLLSAIALSHPDAREAALAILEKRKPVWSDR